MCFIYQSSSSWAVCPGNLYPSKSELESWDMRHRDCFHLTERTWWSPDTMALMDMMGPHNGVACYEGYRVWGTHPAPAATVYYCCWWSVSLNLSSPAFFFLKGQCYCTQQLRFQQYLKCFYLKMALQMDDVSQPFQPGGLQAFLPCELLWTTWSRWRPCYL